MLSADVQIWTSVITACMVWIVLFMPHAITRSVVINVNVFLGSPVMEQLAQVREDIHLFNYFFILVNNNLNEVNLTGSIIICVLTKQSFWGLWVKFFDALCVLYDIQDFHIIHKMKTGIIAFKTMYDVMWACARPVDETGKLGHCLTMCCSVVGVSGMLSQFFCIFRFFRDTEWTGVVLSQWSIARILLSG